MFPIKLP